MMLPGSPVHTYVPDGDDEAFAAWMLKLIDKGPDRLTAIELKHPGTAQKIDRIEDDLIRG